MLRTKKQKIKQKEKFQRWVSKYQTSTIEHEWKPLTSVRYEVPDRNPGVVIKEYSGDFVGVNEGKVVPKYEGEMLERELAAQAEIEKKKLRVAPLHKSNYIYIDDGINPAGLGRKNEVL